MLFSLKYYFNPICQQMSHSQPYFIAILSQLFSYFVMIILGRDKIGSGKRAFWLAYTLDPFDRELHVRVSLFIYTCSRQKSLCSKNVQFESFTEL